jgi:hypothetical protein
MIYIICLQNSYVCFSDYLSSIRNKIDYSLILSSDITLNKTDKFIFMENIPSHLLDLIDNTFTNIYLLNTEQLSVEHKKNAINNIPSYVNIIDYNYSNIKYYNQIYNIYVLPYQINFNEIYNYDKTKDVCIISSSSSHRENIIKRLLNEYNINVTVISGWDRQRDKELFKYKILLNISYFSHDTCKVLETLRCDRCIYNKMIVVSDMKDDINSYYLKEHIIFSKYENIPIVVKYILDNYDFYYNNLFKNFSFDLIDKRLNDISKNIIDKLSE